MRLLCSWWSMLACHRYQQLLTEPCKIIQPIEEMRALTWANQRKVIACRRHWACENAKDHVIFRSYCYIWLGEKCGAMFPSQSSRRLRFTLGLDRKPQSFANKFIKVDFTDDSHVLTRFATVNGLDVKLRKNSGNYWSAMTKITIQNDLFWCSMTSEIPIQEKKREFYPLYSYLLVN